MFANNPICQLGNHGDLNMAINSTIH